MGIIPDSEYELQCGSSIRYGLRDSQSPGRLPIQPPVSVMEKREVELRQKESVGVVRGLGSQACKRGLEE